MSINSFNRSLIHNIIRAKTTKKNFFLLRKKKTKGTKMSNTQCRGCHNSNPTFIMEDESTGDRVCMKCGLVMGRVMCDQAEWRDYQEDQHSKSRVGMGNSIYKDPVLGTITKQFAKGTGSNRDYAIRSKISATQAKVETCDKATNDTINRIGHIADVINLPQIVQDTAKQMYHIVSSKLKERKKNGIKVKRLKEDGVIVAIILLASRYESCSLTLKSIITETSIDKKDAVLALKELSPLVPRNKIEGDSDAVANVASRICSSYGIHHTLQAMMVASSKECRKIFTSNKPDTVAASVVWLISRKILEIRVCDDNMLRDVEKITLESISERVGVNENTIKTFSSKVENLLDRIVPINFIDRVLGKKSYTPPIGSKRKFDTQVNTNTIIKTGPVHS